MPTLNFSSNSSCPNIFISQDKAEVFAHDWRTSGYPDTKLSTCVCNSVFGPGNPDISGVGVRVALFIQAASYLLFGVLPTIASLCLRSMTETTQDTLVRFQDVFVGIFRTSSLFAITSLIAACSRLAQGPPAYEISTMQDIVMFELSLHALAIVVFSSRQTPERLQSTTRRWTYWHTSFAAAAGTLAWGVMHDRFAVAMSIDTVQRRLMTVCTRSGQYPAMEVFERNVSWLISPVTALVSTLLSVYTTFGTFRTRQESVRLRREIALIKQRQQERTQHLVSTYVRARIRLWVVWWRMTVERTPGASMKTTDTEAIDAMDNVLEPCFREVECWASVPLRRVKSAPLLATLSSEQDGPRTVPTKRQRLPLRQLWQTCSGLLEQALVKSHSILVTLFYDPATSYKLFRVGLSSALTAILVATVVWKARILAIHAHMMQQRIGSDDEDQEWGFGQMAAVLIWLPATAQAAKAVAVTAVPARSSIMIERVWHDFQMAIGVVEGQVDELASGDSIDESQSTSSAAAVWPLPTMRRRALRRRARLMAATESPNSR